MGPVGFGLVALLLAGLAFMMFRRRSAANAARAGGARSGHVQGTPVTGLWWATVPGEGAATVTARALQRFLTTPDATTALLSRPLRPARTRPTVRVELWS